jgi:small subunit ribosomal protein S16
MLTIRLSRVGKKKQPLYRFVIMDKKKDPWGKSLEILGMRNPRTKETVLKADRIKYWIDKGAQASDSVWNILVDQKIVEGKKRNTTHISKDHAKKLAGEKAKQETPAA